jgi:site-specific DNA recombinase
VKRCALYARYSSDLQSPSSIDDQLQLCRGYAERQGWTVVATFQDAALSGFGVEHRPGYQELLAAALSPARSFDVIVVEDLSRLTRDMAELLRLHHRLRLRGLELVGVSDGIATGRQGAKVQLAVKGLVNELYLDDLRDKTHRGLAGRVSRGLSAGGRIFGYRAVPAAADAQGRTTSARFEIDPVEAEVVRRIFREYADGRSMRDITHTLNEERVPFPAQQTKRGPNRRGWAFSTINVILRNEKYAGVWIWNRTRFLKDPDSGRRRPVPRPLEEWVRQERRDLRVVSPELWDAAQARLRFVAESYGPGAPRGRAAAAYSSYLLSGILRCGICGGRMGAQTATRRKGAERYKYDWYRCSFARDKGRAICTHGTWYRRSTLEGALVARYREAMTPGMIEVVTRLINEHLDEVFRGRDTRLDALKTEILRLETEAGNLVQALAQGVNFDRVREELAAREGALQGLRVELAEVDRTSTMRVPRAHPGWIRAQLERLDELVRTEPGRAKAELVKHLDGELTIRPLPAAPGERRAEIVGRVKADGLLAAQEAVCLQVVAGAGFEPATFGL